MARGLSAAPIAALLRLCFRMGLDAKACPAAAGGDGCGGGGESSRGVGRWKNVFEGGYGGFFVVNRE